MPVTLELRHLLTLVVAVQVFDQRLGRRALALFQEHPLGQAEGHGLGRATMSAERGKRQFLRQPSRSMISRDLRSTRVNCSSLPTHGRPVPSRLIARPPVAGKVLTEGGASSCRLNVVSDAPGGAAFSGALIPLDVLWVDAAALAAIAATTKRS